MAQTHTDTHNGQAATFEKAAAALELGREALEKTPAYIREQGRAHPLTLTGTALAAGAAAGLIAGMAFAQGARKRRRLFR